MVWPTLNKTEWSDIHRGILGCVTYIGEFWAVWLTQEKTGLCDIHQRILGYVTYYLGKNKSPSWIKEYFDFKFDKIMIISMSLLFQITFLEFRNRLHLQRHALVKSIMPFWSTIPPHNLFTISENQHSHSFWCRTQTKKARSLCLAAMDSPDQELQNGHQFSFQILHIKATL